MYIGQTNNMRRRWNLHKHPKSKCTKLANSIKKYGVDKFKMEQILACESKEEANVLERQLIWWYGTRIIGYNITPGGEGTGVGANSSCYGRKLSEEHKQRLRELGKLKVGAKNHRYGKKHSIEAKRKMSEQRSGEKHPMYGKIRTDIAGENHHCSKLTNDQRQEIFELYTSKQFNQYQLADMYNVDQTAIGRIIKRRRVDKHVDERKSQPTVKWTPTIHQMVEQRCNVYEIRKAINHDLTITNLRRMVELIRKKVFTPITCDELLKIDKELGIQANPVARKRAFKTLLNILLVPKETV